MSLEVDPSLGRIVRRESWPDLTVSTYRRIEEAIRANKPEEAAAMLDYFHEEALVCRRIFDQWLPGVVKFLVAKGVSEVDVASLKRRLEILVAPKGQPSWDREKGWSDYLSVKEGFRLTLISAASPRPSSRALEQAMRVVKEAWRVSHDLDVDMLLGFFDAVIEKLGEVAIGEMWERHLIRGWFEERYAHFDMSKVDWKESFQKLVFLSFEAMHGHLCGPRREGDVEYQEYADRVELSFDPCGSGGRAYRGEPLDGTGSRMEAPYHFRAIAGAYDFTWNKPGICTYCAHCCVLTERLPAQTFGYPVRVVDPPSYPYEPGAKCRYTIYKNVRDIPDTAYRRLGLEKPTVDQQLGSAHGPFGK
jgi:hypothetical protein